MDLITPVSCISCSELTYPDVSEIIQPGAEGGGQVEWGRRASPMIGGVSEVGDECSDLF